MSENDAKKAKKLFSLEEMAFNTIVQNVGRYKELIKSKVSPPFRKELYIKATEASEGDYEKKYGLWTALPYLEPYKTKEDFFLIYDFDWIVPKFEVKTGETDPYYDKKRNYEVSLDEILRYLVHHAPNLKKIDLYDPRPFYYENIFKKLRFEPSSIDLIIQMKNLTIISLLGFNIDFLGFVRICRECKNLQEIEADKISVDVPKSDLKAILDTFDTAFDHQEYTEYSYRRRIEIIFKKMDSAVKYRKATVPLSNSKFLDYIPEMSHLKTPCEYAVQDYQFHKMSLQHLLGKVGGNLNKLCLYFCKLVAKITFQQIFEHCKNLESLHLRGSSIADDEEPTNSFGKPKELVWHNTLREYPINLKGILSAPLLEKIDLMAFEFDLGDVEVLLGRIRNGEICTNVRKFMVQDLENNDDPVWNVFYGMDRSNSPVE